ncbi:MAG: MFS transporter [Anaerolineae bacterium]|nr:MFS transporter [Anaerolineae bacterium]MDQ7034187.1 MFS transporter [Anaerolineae bacterium]
MQETKQSGLDFSRALPIFVLVFVDVLGLTVILPLLHLYAAAYGATPIQIGLVAAAFPLAQLIGVPMMSALSDRFGRKPLLLISQITTCASFIMLGLANSLTMIILSRVIDGLFGANIATAQAALSDITDDNTRTQGLGLTGAAFGLGFIFGPVISLLALEIGDSLALPALSAAGYSFISILLTLFIFKETLPPEKRGAATGRRLINPFVAVRYLLHPMVGILLILMFAQQFIFFGFETLLGLFTLSRLGLTGGANAYIFIVIGLTLVMVQVRFIGKWSRKYGEYRLVQGALGLLAIGLILMAFTPKQPHIFYVKEIVEFDLREQVVTSTEAILGNLNIALPENENRGIFGVLWVFVMVVPLSIGAGLIRPSLNSLMTKHVGKGEYGSILGVSSSFVSAANATAPILGGWMFQQYGSTLPFLIGGVLMGILALSSLILVKPIRT